MLRRREMVNSGDSSYKNSKGKKRKRRWGNPSMGNPKNLMSPITRQYVSVSTFRGNKILKSCNINPTREETLFVNDSSLKFDHFRIGIGEGNIQLLSDLPQCPEDDEWTRTVRSRKKDSFGAASTCPASIECCSQSNVGSENREQLRSTDIWRKLIFPEADMGPLLISEEIFKENVKVLLDGIDLAVSKPSVWSRLDSNYFFNKIQSFAVNWSREVLKEKEKLVEEVLLAKERLKIKYDLVTNRLSLLTGVFEESVISMNFSESQKQAIQSHTRELNIIKSNLIDCEGDNSVSQIASSTSHLKEKDRELEESRKKADECREELRQTQNKLNATEAEINGLIYANIQKTRLEQKEMQNQLSEIRSMLVKKADLGNYSSRYFNGDLNNENNEIIKDIKSLIDYQDQSSGKVEVIGEIIPKIADSCILKVTENEMHLVTLIASFMKVTPFPVSTEFIYLYVAKIDNIVNLQYIEKLLKKFPTFFKEEALAPGSTEKNWRYLDLKPIITI